MEAKGKDKAKGKVEAKANNMGGGVLLLPFALPICRLMALALVSVFFVSSINAQNEKNVDSLYAIWADETNSDEQRVDAFYQRWDPLVPEPVTPEVLRWSAALPEAMRMIEEMGGEKYLGRFLTLECVNYFMVEQDLEEGCIKCKEAFEVSLELADYESAVGANAFLLNCYGLDLNRLYEENLDLDTLVPALIPLYADLLSFYYSNSRLPEVLRLAQRILVLPNVGQENYQLAIATTLMYIGISHSLIGNSREAEKYLLQSLVHAKNSEADLFIGRGYTNLVSFYLEEENLPLARAYLDTAITIMEGKEECKPCMIKLQRIIAGRDNLAGHHREALDKLLGLEDFYDREVIAMNNNIGNFYLELSRAYFGLGRFREAIASARKGIGKTNAVLYTLVPYYRIIYECYREMGDYRMALEYYQQYVKGLEARTEVRNSQAVTKQELAFQFEQQRLADSLRLEQQKIEQKFLFEKEISRQKNSRNIFSAFGLLALILAFGMYSRYRYTQKTKTKLEEKNRIIEAEKEKAKASERAKHQFLANMSHEIRTPMNAVKGMTEILLRRQPRNNQREYLNGIKQSADSLLVIINDILDISKIESGKVELEERPISVREVVQNVHTIMQFKAEEKGLELRLEIPDEELGVNGDDTRLRQILLNLIGNAVKFTEKGDVTTTVRIAENERDQLKLHFTVSDTGIGITPDRIDKIFATFEQAYSDTSRKFGGTGLGLSISKKLVELQGGRIWVESEKGMGSRFHFTIAYPRTTTTDGGVSETVDQPTEITEALSGLRVLLVEDNAFNAIVAREELEDFIDSVSVSTAENGAIALEKLMASDYDLILMDVQMPIMNGYEATAAIRALPGEKRRTPIIAMTANVMQEEVERCYAAGMNDFIGKPFDTQELLHKIHHLQIQLS